MRAVWLLVGVGGLLGACVQGADLPVGGDPGTPQPDAVAETGTPDGVATPDALTDADTMAPPDGSPPDGSPPDLGPLPDTAGDATMGLPLPAQWPPPAPPGGAPVCSLTPPSPAAFALESNFVLLPPGTFELGAAPGEGGTATDQPHTVTVSKAFWIMRTEVDQQTWTDLMKINPSANQCAACPVENVNWYEAAAFANELSKEHGLQECYTLESCFNTPGSSPAFNCAGQDDLHAPASPCTGYRLPTEAELEWATRAGEPGPRFDGGPMGSGCSNDPSLVDYGWYCHNAGGSTHPVATRDPNPWGLFDVYGNVEEWTTDVFATFPADPACDPMPSGTTRSIRGCSYASDADECHSAVRRLGQPYKREAFVGFRLVRAN